MSTGLDPQQSDLTTGFVPFPADRAEEYRRAGYWTGRSLDSILDRRRRAVAGPHRCRRPGRLLHVRRTGRPRRPDRVGIGGSRYRGRRPGDAAASEFRSVRRRIVRTPARGRCPGDVPAGSSLRRAQSLRRRQRSGRPRRCRPGCRIRLSGTRPGSGERQSAAAATCSSTENPDPSNPSRSWPISTVRSATVRRSTRVRPPCCWCPAARRDCRS